MNGLDCPSAKEPFIFPSFNIGTGVFTRSVAKKPSYPQGTGRAQGRFAPRSGRVGLHMEQERLKDGPSF